MRMTLLAVKGYLLRNMTMVRSACTYLIVSVICLHNDIALCSCKDLLLILYELVEIGLILG